MEMERSLKKAQHLLNQDRFGEAQVEVKNYLAAEPENIDGLTILAQTHIGLENYEQADKIVNDILKIDATDPSILYLRGVTQYQTGKRKNALTFLNSALSFDPMLIEAHAVKSMIFFEEAKFEDALASANEGLRIDPQNEICLNNRSRALLKLNRSEERLDAERQALKANPMNPHTHATVGFAELEKNNTKKAKEHFKEALKLDPNNKYAREGMMHAIKATNPYYRLFLKYAFWMQGLTPQARWAVIIIGYVLVQILDSYSGELGVFSPVARLFVILYIVFAISTWIIGPVSNMFLKFHSFGKYLLKEEEIKTANLSAILLGLALIGAVIVFTVPEELLKWYNFGFYIMCSGIAMTIVVSSIENAYLEKSKRNLKAAGKLFGSACLILILISLALPGLALKLFNWLVFGFIGYQFYANTQQ